MMNPIDRRSFLRVCQAGLVAAGTSRVLCGRESEPIKRNDTPKFKFSLAAYSYRNLLNDKQATFTLFDFVNDCAKLQLEGTELTSYYFPNPVTPEYLRELKAHCFRLGLDVSGTAVGNDFGFPPGEKRQQQIDSLKSWIDHAEVLGAPVIRIFAGHAKKDVPSEQSHELMVSGIQECCDYAAQRGVFLALENHGGPTATADGLMKLVHAVKSPWFGVNLDTGNFDSDDVYGDLARVAPYALNVQVKVIIRQGGQRQPMDFKRLAQILKDAAYRGYVVLEYEEKEDPRTACAMYMDQIREAFSA